MIDDALSNREADSVKVELHSLRGGFALAGDTDARDACAHAERTVTEGGMDAFAQVWPDCRAVIERTLARLTGM